MRVGDHKLSWLDRLAYLAFFLLLVVMAFLEAR
jgi:hypothetical protein